MAAIIGIGLPHGNEDWAQSSLPTFGNDNILHFGQISGEPADESKLEPTGAHSGFGEMMSSSPDIIWDDREGLLGTACTCSGGMR
jgi:hypothetical protein